MKKILRAAACAFSRWKIRGLLISAMLLLAASAMVACIAPPVSEVAVTAPTSTGSQLRVEAVWSQPAILMAAPPAPTPCMDMATAAQFVNPCEADGNELPPCATPEVQPADAHAEHMQMAATETTAMGARGVVYLTIVNAGDAVDYLTNIQSTVAVTAEIHQTTMDANGVMKMRHVEGKLEIPPGDQVKFEPGSYHIMLIDLKQDLKVSDRFQVVLTFEKSGAILVESEVRLPTE